MKRLAYITQVDITNEDGEVIGCIKHEVDDLHLFHPKSPDTLIVSDDYRHIAETLESPWLDAEVIETTDTDSIEDDHTIEVQYEKVFKQIQEDVCIDDYSGIYKLLKRIPNNQLQVYLDSKGVPDDSCTSEVG